MTNLDALKAISNYPIPQPVIELAAVRRGVDLTAAITPDTFATKEYIRAEADIKIFLSKAPNITEAGIIYELSPADRSALRSEAAKALSDTGATTQSVIFGYKGQQL